MTPLPYERYCAEIGLRVGELTELVRAGGDLGAAVPTCPGWSLGDLLRHAGGALRWVEALVRERSEEYVPPVGDSRLLEDIGVVEALREAGPGVRVWSWAGQWDTAFWARRMAAELTVHAADAAFAAGTPYAVAPEIAADVLDEWLEIVVWVQRNMPHPAAGELYGGRVRRIGLVTPDAGWVVGWGPEGVGWRRVSGVEGADTWTVEGVAPEGVGSGGAVDVVLRGPLPDVLLAFYRRLPLDSPPLQVTGERGVLEYWLERARMG